MKSRGIRMSLILILLGIIPGDSLSIASTISVAAGSLAFIIWDW